MLKLNLQDLQQKIRNNRVKLIIIGSMIFVSFVAGTFWPNNTVKNQMTQDLKTKARAFGLAEPLMHYYNQRTFIESMSKCIDYLNFELPREQEIPKAIIIGMAMMESDNGTSRFATEGNALFGVRTWDPKEPQIKAYRTMDTKWGIRKYPTKCASVRDMITILNTKSAHSAFQRELHKQRLFGKPNIYSLANTINSWATNPEYSQQLKTVIRDNGLDKLK
jgi:uncharacterized FlgJ-related protein